MRNRTPSVHTESVKRPIGGLVKRLIVTLLATAGVVGTSLVGAAVPAAAWVCPDSAQGYDGICLYEDKDYETDDEISSSYTVHENSGYPIGKWEETVYNLHYKFKSHERADYYGTVSDPPPNGGNNLATSIANSTDETVYFYDNVGCRSNEGLTSLGSGYGDSDLADGTGAQFDDQISSFARYSYLDTCRDRL